MLGGLLDGARRRGRAGDHDRAAAARSSENRGAVQSSCSDRVTTAIGGWGGRPASTRAAHLCVGERHRAVALGPHGAGTDQHDVGLGPELAEERPVGLVRQPGHPAVDRRRPVQPGHHVGDDPARRRLDSSPCFLPGRTVIDDRAGAARRGPAARRAARRGSITRNANGQVDQEAGDPVEVAAHPQPAPVLGRFEDADRTGDGLACVVDAHVELDRWPGRRGRAAPGPRSPW